MVKPREWIIFDASTGLPRLMGPDIAYADNPIVIEKSAFDKAVEVLKKECWSGAYGVEGKSCNCEPCTTLKELGVES